MNAMAMKVVANYGVKVFKIVSASTHLNHVFYIQGVIALRGKMRAVMYYGPKKLRIEEVSIPKIGEGDLLVRIRAATTCGTDLKTYLRGYRTPPPFILGHEWAGDVVEIGPRAPKHFEIGMKISGVNTAPCFTCYYCRRMQYQLCERLFDDGLAFLGTYAEYVRIPERLARINVFPIPEGVPYEHVALTEPLACVLNAVEETNIQINDRVVVIGAGPIGLFFIQLLKLRGVQKIISIDVKKERLALAKSMGADEIINPSEEDPVKIVKDFTENVGADVVVEAVGKVETWELAYKLVRKGGVINWFGGPPSGAKIALDAYRFHYDSIRALATFHLTPSTAKKAFDLIVHKKIDVEPLITYKMPLEKAEEALQLMAEGEALKVALLP